MRILAVSDLHLDAAAADALLSAAPAADLILAAGDFADNHRGLARYMDRLAPLADRMICVPGNNETESALRDATAATVLHGQTTRAHGLAIAGLGGGVPPLPPQPWGSWDLSEDQARTALDPIDGADILITHSPPAGLGDNHASLGRIGSTAIKDALLRLAPRLAVFGHVHDCWGETGTLGTTHWRNLGPQPVWFTL
ncbi:metallophosphoesterase family protein [Palleronia rufa]|uniref:metallophosphoesterase family protein n=1 Tax=Palleronia rufa TaxID=1530186 RepID=UPI00055AFFE0|nr:metallophosphoesterase [Palleronia rufa]